MPIEPRLNVLSFDLRELVKVSPQFGDLLL
jgi:hypothetical protein